AVRWYVEAGLAIYGYFALVDDRTDRTLQMVHDVAKDKSKLVNSRSEATTILTHALRLLNLAIAQHAILSGTVFLPDLLTTSTPSDVWALVKINPLLQRNLGTYVALRSSPTFFYYAVAYNMPPTEKGMLSDLIRSDTFPALELEKKESQE